MIVAKSVTAVRFLRPHWRAVLAIIAIVVVVEVANDFIRFDKPVLSLASVGLLVTSLSIFLVFRVNESYARWWEARTLWGQLVNSSRAFARQATTLIGAPGADATDAGTARLRRELIYRQIAFVNALRLSLRREDRWDELAPFLAPEELEQAMQAENKPTWLLQRQGEQLADAQALGWLTEIGMNQFDRTLRDLHDVQGACERIKNTPFPEGVAYVTRAVAWLMAVVIAVATSDPSNQFDPVDMLIVPVIMLSFVLIERMGAELKNPFENQANDTPMTALCRTIEIDLRQILGEQQLPPPIEPVGGVLL